MNDDRPHWWPAYVGIGSNLDEPRRQIATAIDDLPEIYRVPVVLRDIQGLTTEEASSRLRVKDQTLKSRLHRGRVMLRRRLATA